MNFFPSQTLFQNWTIVKVFIGGKFLSLHPLCDPQGVNVGAKYQLLELRDTSVIFASLSSEALESVWLWALT